MPGIAGSSANGRYGSRQRSHRTSSCAGSGTGDSWCIGSNDGNSGAVNDARSADLFDGIGMLQADAALQLGFDRDARCAATSPGPAFPAALRTLADAVPHRSGATVVDLGAGLGGASAWLERQTGAQVIAVEPAAGARIAARRMFPWLDIRAGSAECSHLPSGIADAVVLLGLISLLDDLDGPLAEARRLLRDGGVIGIADMFLARPGVERSGVNTLRSLAATTTILARGGWEVLAVGCANDAAPDEAWRVLANELKDRVLLDHADDPAVVEWIADQRQVAEWVNDGHVFGACLVARPTRR